MKFGGELTKKELVGLNYVMDLAKKYGEETSASIRDLFANYETEVFEKTSSEDGNSWLISAVASNEIVLTSAMVNSHKASELSRCGDPDEYEFSRKGFNDDGDLEVERTDLRTNEVRVFTLKSISRRIGEIEIEGKKIKDYEYMTTCDIIFRLAKEIDCYLLNRDYEFQYEYEEDVVCEYRQRATAIIELLASLYLSKHYKQNPNTLAEALEETKWTGRMVMSDICEILNISDEDFYILNLSNHYTCLAQIRSVLLEIIRSVPNYRDVYRKLLALDQFKMISSDNIDEDLLLIYKSLGELNDVKVTYGCSGHICLIKESLVGTGVTTWDEVGFSMIGNDIIAECPENYYVASKFDTVEPYFVVECYKRGVNISTVVKKANEYFSLSANLEKYFNDIHVVPEIIKSTGSIRCGYISNRFSSKIVGDEGVFTAKHYFNVCNHLMAKAVKQALQEELSEACTVLSLDD